jgi:cyclase
MLRHRVITVLTLNEGVLFRTKEFRPDYRYTMNFVDAWSIDEIVLLDVTRDPDPERRAYYDVVEDIARRCFVPLACGGHVRSVDDIRRLLRSGADKIVLNTAAFDSPAIVTEAAALYGSQCVIVSIDTRRRGLGHYEVYVDQGSRGTGMAPAAWARRAQDLGAGEILVTSIERDGSLEGYDNDLNRLVADSVGVPVLVCGGAGNWQHFRDGFRLGGAAAVCTTNIYHFTETSIRSAKRYLNDQGVPVRMEP